MYLAGCGDRGPPWGCCLTFSPPFLVGESTPFVHFSPETKGALGFPSRSPPPLLEMENLPYFSLCPFLPHMLRPGPGTRAPGRVRCFSLHRENSPFCLGNFVFSKSLPRRGVPSISFPRFSFSANLGAGMVSLTSSTNVQEAPCFFLPHLLNPFPLFNPFFFF